MRARSALVVISLVAAGLAASAPSASALFHLMKVTEVFAGTTLDGNVEFVELQMYANGQDLVGGHDLEVYQADGSMMDCTIPQHVTNGSNQSHILFATAEAQAAFGAADFTMPPLLSGAGGAVCFGPGVDCATWGSFVGSVSDDKGAVVNPEPAIPAGQSIHRDLKGNSTLENADDTNNSNLDFAPGAESATPNGVANLGTLACEPGSPGGGGGGGGGGGQGDPSISVRGLKTKTPGNKAVISGRIEPPEPGAKVKLILFAKSSPFRKVAKKTDTLDGNSRFKKRFTVPSASKRCRIVVKYRGTMEAKKKFKC